MLTKKHYDFIAEILNKRYRITNNKIHNGILTDKAENELYLLILDIAINFEKDNSDFNREQFLDACLKGE